MGSGTPYRSDSLYMTEDTTVDEIVDYLRRCLENPIVRDEDIIWNFSTHEMDWEALEKGDWNRSRFVVPYQVTGAWGFMFQLLPEKVKEAETLVYNADSGQYFAYRSLYRTTEQQRQEQIRNDLARRLESECEEVLDLHA